MTSSLRLTLFVSLVALSVVGRLALLAVPGVSLSFLVVALAGLAYGVRMGAAVGGVGRLASDLLITGFNPIFLPMMLVEALMGAIAGSFGHLVDVGQARASSGWWPRLLLANFGLLFTVAFSVLSDTVTWLFYNLLLPNAPDAAQQALWGTLVAAGLVFNAPSTIFNTLLFPLAIPPVLHGLRESGLLFEGPGLVPTTN